MKKILIIILFFIIFFKVNALWRWEKEYLFKNKITGEYKKTHQNLYRFDEDNFRDTLEEYISNKKLPNSTVFKNWDIVSYKLCDRQYCIYKWLQNDFNIDYPIITQSDFLPSEWRFIYLFSKIKSFFIWLLLILLLSFKFRKNEKKKSWN